MEPRALAAKFEPGTDDVLRLLAIPFGGPFGGRDSDGEYFSAKTDLCLDWFPAERPLLYHHGLDDATGVSVIGRVDASSATKAVDGWWVSAQLNKAHQYFDSIKRLVDEGALYGSSGAMPHLVQKDRKSGELLRWPWVEQSLTPTPANPFARVEMNDAAKHYKAAGLVLTAPVGGESYADTLERLTDEVAEFVGLTRKVGDQRAKVGRPQFSESRRGRLQELARLLDELLTETEPKPPAIEAAAALLAPDAEHVSAESVPTEQKGAAAAALTEFLRFQQFLAQEHARG